MPSARPEGISAKVIRPANVTLTFDNGPEPLVTPAVLDCLARHNIRTTFFVMGRKAATPEGAALVRRASAEGHWIGNHTFSHQGPLGTLHPQVALRDFELAEQTLASLTADGFSQPHRLFRPPGSGKLGKHLLHPAIMEKLKAGRYTCVLWNSVPGDFRDPHGWLERAVPDCQSRDWTLMALHDLPNGAMEHLDEFIVRLRGQGFHLTQEFPSDCLPMVDGVEVLPLDPYLSG